MWVILCAAYWVQYSSQDIAMVDYNEHGDIAAQYSCGAPQAATIEEVIHYRSESYAPHGVPGLQYIKMFEENAEEQKQKEQMEAAKPGSSKPQEETPKTVQQEAAAMTFPTEKKDEETPRCKYWFEKTSPHSYKLWRQCPGKDPV